MGFLGDLETGLAIAGGPLTFALKDAIDRKGSGYSPGGPTDRRHTFVPRTSSNQSVSDLINALYNTEKAREYGNTFDQAYQNLNQPLRDSGRDDVYVGGTRALASSFADRVFKKTGRLPTEDQVRQFVGQNLNQGFAEKFILGMAPEQIDSLSDDFISGNPEVLADPSDTPESRIKALKSELDKVYGAGKESLTRGIEDIYGSQKRNVVNDLASQGMLTNPNSRYSLNELEANKGKSLSSGLSTLEGERAAGQLDLSKTIESLLANERAAATGRSQFNRTFNAGEDERAFNRGLTNRQLSLSQELGRMQSEASKPGWQDYLLSALSGAGSAAKIYSGLKG